MLDALYREGKIDAAEYLTVRLAAGETESQAERDLANAHSSLGAAAPALAEPGLREPDLPQYSGPSRTARKVPKQGNVLRGHPLD